MTPGQLRQCRECGRPLQDRTSLAFRLSSDCRREMTDEQLAAALTLTRQERALARERSQPGYIPPARRASPTARAHNAEARAAAAGRPACPEHGGLLGACAQCNLEADPAYGVQRIISAIREERRLERDARNEASRRLVMQEHFEVPNA